MAKQENFLSLWRNLTNFWSIVFFIAIIYDFAKDNLLDDFIGLFATIYIAILAIYAGDKEFERWHDFHQSRHPGEFYVAFWTILILLILILDIVLAKPYKIPGEIISTYIAVLSILALTKKSKSMYLRRKK